MSSSTFTLPSAWLPIAMSSIALALSSGYLLVFDAAREADEGAVAHLWQLLMLGQLPVISWFAIRWFRRGPSQALRVLAIQAVAYVAALAPVALFGL